MPDDSATDHWVSSIPFLKSLGLRFATPPDPDAYSVAMDVGPHTANRRGVTHGGAIAALIDHTGGRAAYVLSGRSGPTADLHVRYLRGVEATTLRADARIVRAGRQLIVVDVRVFDELGTLVAIGDMTVVAGRPGEPRTEPPPD